MFITSKSEVIQQDVVVMYMGVYMGVSGLKVCHTTMKVCSLSKLKCTIRTI